MKKTYDLNRHRKSYPIKRVKPKFALIDSNVLESIRIRFNEGEKTKTYNFQKSYSETPVCVTSSENENINAYITEISLNKVVIELSDVAPGDPEVFIHLQIMSVSN